MALLGTKLTSAANGSLLITAHTGGSLPNQRAIVLGTYTPAEPGYITRLGAYARRGDSGGRVYYAVWAVGGNGAPAQLLGRTDEITLGTSFADSSGAILWSDPDLGGAQSAVRIAAGQPLAFGLVTNTNGIDIAALPGTTTHYRRSLLPSALPTDPFGTSSTVTDVSLGFYADFTPDTKPSVSLTAPANGAALGTNTPTLVGAFTDPQSGSPIFDKLRQYYLQVRRQDSGAMLWDAPGSLFVASNAERTAAAFSRLYGGSSLTSGIVYEWRAQVFDDSLVASDWSAWRTFTINPAGQVDTATDGAPSGKQDVASTTIDWTGRWFHPSGLSTNAVQVQILRQGALFRTGALITKTVASTALPGTLFTISDTEAGIGSLQPGEYASQIRGRATDGQFSPWSDPRAFSINAAPNAPSNLQPPSGASSTSQPLLEWNISDPDADDVYGVDDDSEVEITRPNGSVVTVRTSNYDAARGVGFYQTTPTELNAFGTYRWRVRGRDLSAFTAGGNGDGPWSPVRTFDYISGPVVTITNPTEGEVEATSVPIVTWTTTGQVNFQVRAYLADAPLPFKQSSVVVSGTSSFQIPAGWLRNGGSYDLDVIVTNGAAQKGTSLRRRFAVSYPNPVALTNLQASAVAQIRSVEPDTLLLSWDQTTYPPGEFAGYVIRRRLATQTIDEAVVLRTITVAGQNRWVDHWAPGNVTLIYTLSQLRRIGADVIDSPTIELETELPLTTAVLNSAYDGSKRHSMMWLGTDFGGSFDRPEAAHDTWGGEGKPTIVTVPAQYGAQTFSLSITIQNDQYGSLYEHMDDIDALRTSGEPLCLRTERPGERIFCHIIRAPWKRASSVGQRTVRFDLEEIAYQEGSDPNV